MSGPEFVVLTSRLPVAMPGAILARVPLPGSFDSRWFGAKHDEWLGWSAIGYVETRYFAEQSVVRPASLEHARLFLEWELACRERSRTHAAFIRALLQTKHWDYWCVPPEADGLEAIPYARDWEFRIGQDGVLWSVKPQFGIATRYPARIKLLASLLAYLAAEVKRERLREAVVAAEVAISSMLKRLRLQDEHDRRQRPSVTALKLPELGAAARRPRFRLFTPRGERSSGRLHVISSVHMKLVFRSKIEIIGVNPYVLVTAEQAAQLKAGWRKPMPVLVQVNGVPEPPWRINMMPVGDGNFYLYLAGVVRKASGTGIGDEVEVAVEFDDEYQGGPDELPAWFSAALEANTAASANWAALSPSRQKEVVRYLLNLKSDEARERNLHRAMKMLGGEAGHFMGRDWIDGK